MQQRVEEIGAKAERERQADDRFAHDSLLQPSQRAGVEAYRRQQQKARRQVENVSHCALHGEKAPYAAFARKRSIRELAAPYKGGIRIGGRRKDSRLAQLRADRLSQLFG